MSEEFQQVLLYAEPGPQNTRTTIDAALRRARELQATHVLVASDTGKSARMVAEACGKERTVIVVTNPKGLLLPVEKLHDYLPRFREHRESLVARGMRSVPVSLAEEAVAELEASGATVSRIDWKRLQTWTRVSISALDKMGVGVRVATTITAWATIAGIVPPNVEVLALAGTGFGGGGLDTAIVIKTAAAWRDLRVLEILARPRVSPPSES